MFNLIARRIDRIRVRAHAQIAPTTGRNVGAADGADPAWYFYAMLVIDTPCSHSGVGIFDVLVIAAMAEHARRRVLPFVVGAAPGILGFVAADVAVP